MNKTWIYTIGIACALTACKPSTQKPANDSLLSIDVKGAAEKNEELKITDLGEQIRYLPLETNDSCLIGNNPQIMVLEKQVLVMSGNNLYSFDKQTGQFLNSIGHTGEDPQGYTQGSGLPRYNERNGLLYFIRRPNQLQKYDLQGHYQGKAIVPTPPPMPTDYAFIDTLLAGYYNNIAQQNIHTRSLAFFTEAGALTDTVSSLLPPLPAMQISDITSIEIHKYGNAGAILTRFQDGTSSVSIAGATSLWNYQGELRFKDTFNDTIYDVTATGRLTPKIIFDLGKYRLSPQARWSPSDTDGKLLPVFVLETERNIFFQCIEGLTEARNGVYNKQTATTRMGKEEAGFADDINGFLPFKPSTCSAQGEYAQIVETGSVLNWIDEHPEAKDRPAFAPLLKLNEDDNPVIVLVK